MTREQAITRARSATGHGCIYGLGSGGMNPQRAVPWNEDMKCDCSGFVMWALGLPRFDAASGKWYDTSAIYDSALSAKGLFAGPKIEVPWIAALPGDLLVYPDKVTDSKRRHGHVGIVTEVDKGPRLIIDCSASSWNEHSDAIRERAPEPFVNRGIVARYVGFVEVAA